MNEPRYQFWRPIQPVERQPIPEGAEWSVVDGEWVPNILPNFGDQSHTRSWRLPVEVVPIDVAVDAVMAGSNYSEGMLRAGLPHLSVNFAGVLRAKTHEELWSLVIAKLREVSQERCGIEEQPQPVTEPVARVCNNCGFTEAEHAGEGRKCPRTRTSADCFEPVDGIEEGGK